MTRKKYVLGNWKMNGNHAMVTDLLGALSKVALNPEVAVFPPAIYLPETKKLLQHSKVHWGAQNISAYQDGAYTGEISARMIKELGCQFTLVGHSERRQLFGETESMIQQKLQRAYEQGVRPVLCVGETLSERESQNTARVVLAQLQSMLDLRANLELLQHSIIAYEPVWAIGTGLSANAEQAQEVHALLRDRLKTENSQLANIPIVYGGSVKAANAAQFVQMPDIDGALVGGASLNAQEFMAIIEAFAE